MLSCHDLSHHHASDYIDGQLSWRTRFRVRLHLLICVHCRDFIHQLKMVRKVLRRSDELPGGRDREPDQAALQSLSEQLHQLHGSISQSSTPPSRDR
jgi:anti-sigma factor ChrR (cupin superfamily)